MREDLKEEVDSHATNTIDTVDPESSAETRSIPPMPRNRLFYIFIVDKGIGYINFISYLIACFGTICLVVYLSIVQPFVLTVILKVSGNTGNLTGSLALYDEIIALPATIIWGVLSDRVGRRLVYSAGFLCLGVSLILYPYVKNVYPQMLLCRLLFSLGSSACTCMMTGTLGDIAGFQHERGRVSAIVGMFTGFGALVAGMVLIKLPWQMGIKVNNDVEGIRLSLGIVGGCAVGLGVLLFLAIPKTGVGAADGLTNWFKKNIFRQEIHESPKAEEMISPWRMLKYGIMAGRDPRVALAYASSFVCQGGRTCQPAAGDTHMLTGYAQGISLAFAPIFGFACEKLKRSTVLAFAGFIGAIGSIPFAFTDKAPADKSNYVFVTLTGIGQIGMIVTGMTLVNGIHIDPKYRGSVAGVFSFCGAISIMVMARLGGYLFDAWMHGAPFVLMGIVHLIIALLSIYVRIVTPRLERADLAKWEADQKAKDSKLQMDRLN
ncbi:hypothetical protein BGX27_007833 [Mortierella sp. AM989]|nr:hypothetical protein BGX27_007833 [Mortierella sp. AM989]